MIEMLPSPENTNPTPDAPPTPLWCRLSALLTEWKESMQLFRSKGNDDASIATSACAQHLHEVLDGFRREMQAWQSRPVTPSGIQLIAAERDRQIEEEGFTAENDSLYTDGELNDAAITYAMAAARQGRGESLGYILSLISCSAGSPWPWDDAWWKPGDQIRNLVKAGALITAELDRLLHTQTK